MRVFTSSDFITCTQHHNTLFVAGSRASNSTVEHHLVYLISRCGACGDSSQLLSLPPSHLPDVNSYKRRHDTLTNLCK